MIDVENKTQLGCVYTKKWMVEWILDIAGYKNGCNLLTKKIIEPSCGTGAFLFEIANRLITEKNEHKSNWSCLLDRVVAYDIDEEAVNIAKFNVLDLLKKSGCPELDANRIVNNWIKKSDFITADTAKCDFIIGNPPYIRSVNIKRDIRERNSKLLNSVTLGCDLYVSFIDQALNLINSNGVVCFICPDRWLQNSYGKLLRQRIFNNFTLDAMITLHGIDVFERQVNSYPAITKIVKDNSKSTIKYAECLSGFSNEDTKEIDQWLHSPKTEISKPTYKCKLLSRPKSDEFLFIDSGDVANFISKINNQLPSLKESGIDLGIGIATGCDAVFIVDNDLQIEKTRLLPLFYLKDYKQNLKSGKCLVNPWDKNGNLVNLEDYPLLKQYFIENQDRLCSRYVAKKNPEKWYRTIDKVRWDLMHTEMLVIPDMAKMLQPILVKGKYPHHNCYWMTSNIWKLEELGGILISDISNKVIESLGVKMRNGTLRCQAQYLKELHLPYYDRVSQKTKEGLAVAFKKNDRGLATKYAEFAYKESLV